MWRVSLKEDSSKCYQRATSVFHFLLYTFFFYYFYNKQVIFIVKLRRNLWSFWAQKPFCPLFLVAKTPTSRTLPEFQRAPVPKQALWCLLIRKGNHPRWDLRDHRSSTRPPGALHTLPPFTWGPGGSKHPALVFWHLPHPLLARAAELQLCAQAR